MFLPPVRFWSLSGHVLSILRKSFLVICAIFPLILLSSTIALSQWAVDDFFYSREGQSSIHDVQKNDLEGPVGNGDAWVD